MVKHVTTEAGARMNAVYDDIRVGLRDMPPAQAELMRKEIIVLLAMVSVEVGRWRGRKGSRNSRVYREGSVVEAAGGDYDALKAVAAEVVGDLSRLT